MYSVALILQDLPLQTRSMLIRFTKKLTNLTTSPLMITRTFADVMGLEVHGTLGIILWAAAEGYLRQVEARDALKRLSHSSFVDFASYIGKSR